MKTGAYWFKFLTEKEQDEFKGNCKEDRFNYLMESLEDSFSSFIYSVFKWDRTKQGHNYWHEISQRKVE